MKIFLDANVLVTVLCNEYPQFTFASRVLSLCDNSRFKVYTSPICLAIAFYFAEKKNGNKVARAKMQILATKLKICTVDAEAVKQSINNKAIKDLEDGLQYYSAINTGCTCIITQDTDDFYFSNIEVLTAEQFLWKYVVAKK